MFEGQRAPWAFLVAGVLLAAFLAQSFLASRVKSPTFDEITHIAAGLSYVETGDVRANPQHPPLLKTMAGLALLLAGAGEWLRSTPPVAIVGHSLYVYDIGAQAPIEIH
jgi:hypothetical protein